MKRILLLFLLLCLPLAACGSSPAEKLEGNWGVVVDTTVDKILAAQGSANLPPEARQMAKSALAQALGSTTLTFDTKKKTLSGNLMGTAMNSSSYTVKSEAKDSLVIESQGQTLDLAFVGDTLEMKAGGGILVLKKK